MCFFDINEDELFELSHARGDKSLYAYLHEVASDESYTLNELAHSIIEKLDRIIGVSKQSSVFDFYARILGEFGGRKVILARLGSEAEDALDVFLDEALNFTMEGKGGLESFLSQLIAAQPEIKREVDLDRDEVRILTTHSSKGLEAKVVFLVDACGKPWNGSFRPPVLEITDEQETNSAFVWMSDNTRDVATTRKSVEKIESDANAEYRRLLYVGMTRAADRLIVCGYCGQKPPEYPHWHRMVDAGIGA